MKRVILSILIAAACVLFGVIVNALVGAGIAIALGYAWYKGAVISALLALFCAGVYRRNAANSGVFTEVWTGVVLKALREAEEHLGWFARIPDYSQHVQHSVIHFTELGGDPKVLINNTTYPLNVSTLEDADKPVSLDLYETEATAISDNELHAISYDKLGSANTRHKEAIEEARYRKALHAIAPGSHVEVDSPVLLTTGALTGDTVNRRRLTTGDLLRLKAWFDARKVPQGQRVLVLCSDHVQDLLDVSESFERQYNLDNANGRIGRLYGFDIYEHTSTPYYTVSNKTKAGYGAVIGTEHRQASVAYHDKSMMRATGDLKHYFSEAKSDPTHHRNLLNYALRAIVLPLRSKGCTAAIVSAVA